MKDYAKQFSADESRWSFLTGKQDAIFAVAAGFKLTAVAAQGDNPILHDERFLLIDGAGKVRGIYSIKDEAKIAKLIVDANSLAARTTP